MNTENFIKGAKILSKMGFSFDSWMYFRGGFFDDEEKVEKYLSEDT